MRFVKESDYRSKIRKYDLETLLHKEANPSLILFDCELRAIEKISLFLRKRYDLETLFTTYPVYESGSTYTTGSMVWYSSTDNYNAYLYQPISATTEFPSSDAWELVEPREQLLVDWVLTIAIYLHHQRISPNAIPEHRKSSYDKVMMILKAIQSEKAFPFVPRRRRTFVRHLHLR